MKKNLRSLILMIFVGALIFSLAGCGSTKSVPPKAKVSTVQDPLKNTVIEGDLTTAEKSKIVELTTKAITDGVNTDYTKDNLDTVKLFLKYTTDDIAKQYPDDLCTKMLNGQKATKQIIKVEGVTFNKVSKSTDGNTTVEFIIKEHVISHTDERLNGKTFNKVQCKYIFNKDWKICAFAIGDYQ